MSGATLRAIFYGGPRAGKVDDLPSGTREIRIPVLEGVRYVFGDESVHLPVQYGTYHITPMIDGVKNARVFKWFGPSAKK